MSPTATVKDVTEANFTAEVVEASRTRPVVVDFWAPWCGPCRQLSPLLEAAAARYAGEVDVVKVNVDHAASLSRAFRVQGIPAVKAFRGGVVVAEFTGAQPAAVVEQLFRSLMPSEAERLASAAATAEGAEQERLYRASLDAQSDFPPAVVGLARILAGRGDVQEAKALLARVPADADARRLVAELDLGVNARDDDALAALRSRVEAGEADAKVELGAALAAAGRHQEALVVLVQAVSDLDLRDAARAAVLDIFEVRGADDELVQTWRPKLAAALF